LSSIAAAAVVEPVLEQPPKWALLREVLEGVAEHRAAVTAAATAALEQLDTQQQQQQEEEEEEEEDGAGAEPLRADQVAPAEGAAGAAEGEAAGSGSGAGAGAGAGEGSSGQVSVEQQQQQQQQRQLLTGSDVDQPAQLEAGLRAAAAARVLVVVREQHELKQLQRVITQGRPSSIRVKCPLDLFGKVKSKIHHTRAIMAAHHNTRSLKANRSSA